jgi:hypothetical protein
LLVTPFCSTLTTPWLVPCGIVTTICVLFQLTTGPLELFNHTQPFCTEPKFVPVIVICTPGDTAAGDTPVITGALIVNGNWLLVTPFCSTLTTPWLVPCGIITTICVLFQLTTGPLELFNHTQPFCTEPKFVPVIVICIPGDTAAGDTPVITGA